MRRTLLLLILGAIAIGAIPGGLLTAAWVSENLGGDFADQETGRIYLGVAAITFLISSAIFAVPAALTGLAAIAAHRDRRVTPPLPRAR